MIEAEHVADFLEKGLLDNLVSLFKSDRSLYSLLADLMIDERIFVRVGASALVETLVEEDPPGKRRSAEALAPLLKNENPTVRGDAAYLLGIVGLPESLPCLEAIKDDKNDDVREAVSEALELIRSL